MRGGRAASRIACVTVRAHTFSHEHRRGGVRLERIRGVLQVVLVEKPLHLDPEGVEALLHVGIELGELEREHVAVLVLPDERDVDQPNGVRLNEVDERGCDLPRNLLPGKPMIA